MGDRIATVPGSTRIAAVLLVAVAALVAVRPPSPEHLPPGAVASAPGATLDIRVQQTPVTLRDYLLSRRTTAGPFFADLRSRQLGRIVELRATDLPTTAGTHCRATWSQLDTAGQAPASERSWRDQVFLGWPDGLVLPDAEGAFTGELWVPAPNPIFGSGSYAIHVQLACADGTTVQARSHPFPVAPRGVRSRVTAPREGAAAPDSRAVRPR
jgi:hypothetical protein